MIKNLVDNPQAYTFFQAVRLLEKASVMADNHATDKIFYKNPVAGYSPPESESIRFHSQQMLQFLPAEIASIERKTKKSDNSTPAKWHILINFLGLSGAQGVLPYHYTETILQRLKMKDESLLKFLDLFNHRSTSLFYQAGTKYRLPIEYERKKLNPPTIAKHDSHSQALLSLIGLGTEHLLNRLHTRDESLLYYSGLFSKQIRTASGLKQILQHHFDIPVEVKDFVGQWQELIDDVRTRLRSKEEPSGRNACLGKSVMLGRRGWLAQGKIRIILGPLNKHQAEKFAPATKALQAMSEIVQLYARMDYDYDFIIRIKRCDILDVTQLTSQQPSIIGWNAWIAAKPKQHYKHHDTLDITVSADRFR